MAKVLADFTAQNKEKSVPAEFMRAHCMSDSLIDSPRAATWEARHVTFRSRAKLLPGRARTGHEEEIIHLAFRSRRNFPASLQVLMAQQKIQRSHLYLAQEVACTTYMGKKKLAPRRLSFSERRTQNQCLLLMPETKEKRARARSRRGLCQLFKLPI